MEALETLGQFSVDLAATLVREYVSLMDMPFGTPFFGYLLRMAALIFLPFGAWRLWRHSPLAALVLWIMFAGVLGNRLVISDEMPFTVGSLLLNLSWMGIGLLPALPMRWWVVSQKGTDIEQLD